METVMTVNGKPYTVLRLLGKGKGGYSYLVRDGAEQYVLKQIHHEPCDYYQFGDKLAAELRDYERLLKEYIEGDTVFALVRAGALPPACLDAMRAICQKLYAAGLNIDYFPTNFIPRAGTLYYVDYECNAYMEQWDFEHWGIQYWSQTPAFLEYLRDHEN